MSAAAAHRREMAHKIWRGTLTGWSRPTWRLTKKDEAAIVYWEKHGHIEQANYVMRLTDAGRAALLEPWPAGCHSPNSCSRHRSCMYTGCQHAGSAILQADIDKAIELISPKA
ncbi:hypothetical protein [Bradyrhizobium sp. SZCCHNRI3052]|uniref:hypothetical protein n=1 Tax=Bradyrhizobium sp. SZCCHNRI3052 TaxID=3057295 RepID=UPI0029171225|nr:hypothetical protein [Bradyrhizobium sp. SZCCHNRI3052]